MPTYVIGDIHGCYTTLERLLIRIKWKPSRDPLWLVGDLVNRGPDSDAVLEFAWRYRNDVTFVLGNHELHLLAVDAGVRDLKSKDTLEPVFDHPKWPRWRDWLRTRPFVHRTSRHLMLHAGLLPRWDDAAAQKWADRLSAVMSGDDWASFLERLQEPASTTWGSQKNGAAREALAAKVFTMVRMIDRNGDLDLSFKGEPDDAPAGLGPWYAHPDRRWGERRVLFGHWAGHGLEVAKDYIATDSGCVWGGTLSAVRLEDDFVIQEPAASEDIF